MQFPELPLTQPELPEPTLRCRICLRPVAEALELLSGPVCRSCLRRLAADRSLDELSALFCAPILTCDIPTKEVSPCIPNR